MNRLCWLGHKWGNRQCIPPDFFYKKCEKCGYTKPYYSTNPLTRLMKALRIKR